MNYRMCRVEHNPPHSYGDCVRACIATLTDDDNVPHTAVPSPEKSWEALRTYLALHRKFLALFAVEEPFEFMAHNNPGVPYMLICKTAHADHAVVCCDDKVVHDPSHAKSEIMGEGSTGHWVIGIVGGYG